jgi:phosphatidylglycerol:prolipoprotein diacylglycerol transferase
MLVAALIYATIRRYPRRRVLDASVVGIALMHVLGRFGCHLSGDGCYGTPTTLPWPFSVSYENGILPTPIGVRVHPTPIYEAILLAGIAAVLWRLRHRRWPAGVLFATYLVLDGLERFGLEFLRREPFARWPDANLTHAQWFAVVYVFAGTTAILWAHRAQRQRRLAAAAGLADASGPPAWQTDGTAGAPPGDVPR